MESCITKIKNFFQMETKKGVDFKKNKRRLLIPLYQREFKWENEKIETLINDIYNRDKFLGIIILDEEENHYEIVDGQQRITTCYLILLYLYNRYIGSKKEQESIYNIMKSDSEFVLKNDSVGDYIKETETRFDLNISECSDIYNQKGEFIRAYEKIEEVLGELDSLVEIRDFKRKLLDCEVLILFNDSHSSTSPIEQVYLDINEKSQLLDPEDIFKGHCFENFEDEQKKELRNLWVKLKRCSVYFENFGFTDLSKYIYGYLLISDSSYISEKLFVQGKHYLDGKTMDETDKILKEMIGYGNAIKKLYEDIKKDNYYFEDLSPKTKEHRNTKDLEILKIMISEMLECKSVYPKLPFMYLIYQFSINRKITDAISHEQFRKIITNIYIYVMLFNFKIGRKSKSDIDHSIKEALMSEPVNIALIISKAKQLRKEKCKEKVISERSSFDKLSFFFSVMDEYDVTQNWLRNKYTTKRGFTLEHFVVPDNRGAKITWKDKDDERRIDISLPLMSEFKKRTINYIIIEDDLNEQMKDYDIIQKISDIKSWYSVIGRNMPNHVKQYIDYIEEMDEYQELLRQKESEYNEEMVQQKYQKFIEVYFSDESEQLFLEKLNALFMNVFK